MNDHLPASIQTEKTILGAMLLDFVAREDATALLIPEDFILDSHQTIYRVMLEMWGDGVGIDAVTVDAELSRRKKLKAIGDTSYLAHLIAGIPRNPQIETYVRIVKEKSLLRRLLSICNDGMVAASDESEDAKMLITSIEGKLAKLREGVSEEVTLEQQAIRELEAIRRQRTGEQVTFVTSGLDEIDYSHSGFAIGEMTVIGARPNVGKSTLLRQSVIANCKKGNYCHLFTPEMGSGLLLRLYAAVEAKVPFRKLRHASRMDEAELANVEAAMTDVMRWPLKIDDESPITAAEVITRTRIVKRRNGTKLVGLDYLQKLKYGGKASDRHIYVTDAIVGLTAMAKDEQVAVIAISSLTEPDGKNRNKPPTLSDFRQSGDIQYEADTAILMHREVDDETQKLTPKTSLIFAKGRSDEGGVKTVYFDSDYIRFVEQQAWLDKIGA